MKSSPFLPSVSLIALLAALGGTTITASAANYIVSTEAELASAIASANVDGAASSTITLAGNLTVNSPGLLPGINKSLVIDAAGFTLNTPGNAAYAVAGGAVLTIKGAVTGQGFWTASGAGTIVVNGVGSIYSRTLQVGSGQIRVENGGELTVGNSVDGGLSLTGDNASIVVTGVGSKLAVQGTSTVGSAAGSSMTIEAGAAYTSTGGLNLGNAAGAQATLIVRGASTTFSSTSLGATRGTGFITIADGAKVTTSSGSMGGTGAISYQGGTGTYTITGTGSSWTTGQFGLFDGSLSIVDGGLLSTTYTRIGSASGGNGNLLVSGAGSQFIGTLNGASATFTDVGGSGSGSLTIANGGLVSIGVAGAGTIRVATNAAGKGAINIGGAAGQAATGAGRLNAATVQFGPGAGAINFNHTDAAYGFDVALVGNGTLNHIGSGKTRLTANQLAFTGQTNVRAGILEVNGTLGGTMNVYGGSLQGTGSVGPTTNHAGGTIAPGNSIGTLTVLGNYTSNGGRLEIESVLGGDASPADLLLITGDSLLGLAPTLVTVRNVGGTGAATTAGIKIVDVQGVRSDANAFVLDGPAIGGAYRYDLFQHDVATSSDGDWYLRSTGELAPTVPTLENYPMALLGMIDLPTLRQRAGQSESGEPGIITRIEGSAGHYQAASSTAGAAYDSSMFLAQIGIAGRLIDTADGSLTAGLTAQYSRHYASVFSAYGNGSNSTEGFGLGASLTWRGAEGTYVDLQGQVARFTTDLNAVGYSLVENNGGAGFAAGIEAGHAFALDEAWSLTPQAQLSYASVGFDQFTDRFGSQVSLQNGASLKGRVGVALDYQNQWQDAAGRKAAATLYGVTSLTYEFLDGANVTVSGTDLKFAGQKFGAELGLGGTLEWAEGAHALHGEVLGSTSFQGSYAIKGTLGLTSRF